MCGCLQKDLSGDALYLYTWFHWLFQPELIFFSVTIPPALENVDSVLHSMDTGLEMAFDRAKLLSKYLNELLIYVKKKAALGKKLHLFFKDMHFSVFIPFCLSTTVVKQ